MMATDRLFAQPEAWTKMDHEIALQWISINERSAQLPYDVAIQLLGSHHLEHLDEFEMDPIVTQNILEITQAATIKHIQGRNGIRKSYIKLHEVLRFKDWRSTYYTTPAKFRDNEVTYLEYRDSFFSVFRSFGVNHHWKISLHEDFINNCNQPEWFNTIWWGRYGLPISGIKHSKIAEHIDATVKEALFSPSQLEMYEDRLMIRLAHTGEEGKLHWDFALDELNYGMFVLYRQWWTLWKSKPYVPMRSMTTPWQCAASSSSSKLANTAGSQT